MYETIGRDEALKMIVTEITVSVWILLYNSVTTH